MGEEDITSSLSIINLSTGEKVMEVDYPANETELHINNTNLQTFNNSCSIELQTSELDPNFKNELLKISDNQQKVDISFNGNRIIYVQKYKHKSKRINKKWLKRYGYKEIYIPIAGKLENCNIQSYNLNDNSCSIKYVKADFTKI